MLRRLRTLFRFGQFGQMTPAGRIARANLFVNIALTIFTAAAFCAAAYYAHIARQQRDSARDQVVEMQNQVEATNRQTKAVEKSLYETGLIDESIYEAKLVVEEPRADTSGDFYTVQLQLNSNIPPKAFHGIFLLETIDSNGHRTAQIRRVLDDPEFLVGSPLQITLPLKVVSPDVQKNQGIAVAFLYAISYDNGFGKTLMRKRCTVSVMYPKMDWTNAVGGTVDCQNGIDSPHYGVAARAALRDFPAK